MDQKEITGQLLYIYPASADEDYTLPTLFFEDIRLEAADVPEDMELWHVRGDEYSVIGAVEPPSIYVNFSGSLLIPAGHGFEPNVHDTLFDFGAENLNDEIFNATFLVQTDPSEENRGHLASLEAEYTDLYGKEHFVGDDYSFADADPMTIAEFGDYVKSEIAR